MSDALFPLLMLAGYFALQIWVLPRLGVST